MTRVLSALRQHGRSDAGAQPLPTSPPARRPRRSWWRDARVLAGIALIVVSMVIGSRLLAGGSDTVTAWQATRDLAPGAVVGEADAVPVEIPASLAGAFAQGDVPVMTPLTRPVLAGELVPIQPASGPVDARWVTVPVEPLHAPIDLAPGDQVDVWSTPGDDLGAPLDPALVLEAVLVSDVAADGVGMGGEFGVVLQVDPGDAAAVVAAVRAGGIDLVRVPAVSR